METENTNELEKEPATGGKSWLKRLGAAGFLFFLIKGLVWLAIGAAAFLGLRC